MDPDFLQFLLKEDRAWETFLEEIELSSEEGEVLREGLKKHERLMAMEDKEMHQWEKIGYAMFFFLFALFLFCFYSYCTLANIFIIVLTCMFWMYSYYAPPPSEDITLRERILKVFPEVKVKLGKRITQLEELADRADQVHKGCTIANVGANTAGIASGVMSLAGLCLAPVTGGLSVGLSAAALGLNIAATATSVTTSIVEQTNMTSIEAKANSIKTVGISPEELAFGVLHQNSKRFFSFCSNFNNLRKIQGHVLTAENSPPSLLQKLFGCTAKTMTTKDKIFGGATTGLCVLMDAYFLLQASKQLKAGVKLEPAERLRQWSQELERIGDMVTQIHGSLLKSLTLSE
ncbi:apolipoprotein L3-like isoform X3 [Suncus etruscus]|uniref:apolipoprotein L3-like isoform X3 n=1 Tax=Suncus etruscus TaxID=109475 RepID=UPI00211049A7|nr:apolipoprotein L3-like isoform X3 [Suncus etruscus]